MADPTMTVTVTLDCKTAANYDALKARVDAFVPAEGETFTLITDDAAAKCIEYTLERTRPL